MSCRRIMSQFVTSFYDPKGTWRAIYMAKKQKKKTRDHLPAASESFKNLTKMFKKIFKAALMNLYWTAACKVSIANRIVLHVFHYVCFTMFHWTWDTQKSGGFPSLSQVGFKFLKSWIPSPNMTWIPKVAFLHPFPLKPHFYAPWFFDFPSDMDRVRRRWWWERRSG